MVPYHFHCERVLDLTGARSFLADSPVENVPACCVMACNFLVSHGTRGTHANIVYLVRDKGTSVESRECITGLAGDCIEDTTL